ncbi:MAG TPA: hypothetical protein PLR64_02745 [Candidatus Dojkabacteria bacterium]|nr:hypothetical protein [Candidatus Dojkabacteria bacterium]
MNEIDYSWISVNDLPLPEQERIIIKTKDFSISTGFICPRRKEFIGGVNIKIDDIAYWKLDTNRSTSCESSQEKK